MLDNEKEVKMEGNAYYVDVGFGAPLFDPLHLEEQCKTKKT